MNQSVQRLASIPAALALVLFAFAPSAAAKDNWVEVRSPNFTVVCNDGEKEARKIADQFEQFPYAGELEAVQFL